MAALEPADAREAAEMIRQAGADGRRLEIRGGGSKAAYGACDPPPATVLDTRRMAGVIDYDPQEFVLTAGAGATLSDIEPLLAAHGQRLGFEPPDLGPLLGAAAGQATLGGVIAANLSGPRRILAGAARDHFLGFEAVSGRGVVFKAGGRVVKNVTGFDLPKLMAGSWGALALLTSVTLRTQPAPRASATLRLHPIGEAQAVSAMGAAMRAPLEVSAAAWLDRTLFLRLEGFGASVAARVTRLSAAMGGYGGVETLTAIEADETWRGIAALAALTGKPGGLWRISVPPASGAQVAEMIGAQDAPRLIDWAGGLVWMRLDAARAGQVRAVAEQLGGHATLVLADGVRDAPAFHPQSPAQTALADRVRTAFDPGRVFVDRRGSA